MNALRRNWRATGAAALAITAASVGGFLLLRAWLIRDLAGRLAREESVFRTVFSHTGPSLPPGVADTVEVQLSYVRWRLEKQRTKGHWSLLGSARRQMAQTEDALAALERDPDRDPFVAMTGVVLRGYRSPVDSDLASYSMRIPEEAGRPGPGGAPLPLIVHLHGRSELDPFQGHPAPDYGPGVLVVAPHGKGAIDFMGPGEPDALAAIDDVQTRYRVGATYLTGASMGGTGTWHLAVHHPWRFTAVAAVSGNADARVWARLWDRREAPQPAPGAVAETLARLKALDSPVTYAANLKEVPALVIHGDVDEVVPVGHSRSMVRALREAGCPVEYREIAGGGHRLGGTALRIEIARWFLTHHARDGAGQRPSSQEIERLAGERRLAGAGPEFSEIFNRRFRVVYGTGSSDDRMNAMLKREAEAFVRDWERRFAARPPICSDRERTAAGQAADSSPESLLLYGGPADNSVARELMAAAAPPPPLRFEPGRCALDAPGGTVVVEGPTAGAKFCWASPSDPEHLFGIVWGASWRALVDVNNRFGQGFDWAAHRNRQWFGFALFDDKTAGPTSFPAVGLWGQGPSLDERRAWRRNAAAPTPPGGAPLYWAVEEAPRNQPLALEKLLPAAIEQLDGPVGFGRGWDGGTLSAGSRAAKSERGLGVRPPSLLAYEIGGLWSGFAATVGADLEGRSPKDLAPPRVKYGGLVFVVRGDGRELARTSELGPADEAVELRADLRGVRRLEIEVRAASRYDWHAGPATWGEARLLP